MKPRRIRWILIATVTLTAAILGLTAGTASAQPRSGSYCAQLADQATADYAEAIAWANVENIDWNAGRYQNAYADHLAYDDTMNIYYADVATQIAYGC